ncbi:TIGR04255 family protein [Amycolatopsis sp. NPDC049252]|uniref:TIGR04255 family protein n=1 Tax=Amycolatopsis sp. NPDC049252 TaxID=3363933 RepID=UPI00371B6922
MSEQRQPPVDEVVLSFAFDKRGALLGPRAGLTLESFLQRFPTLELRPPYEMPAEFPPGPNSLSAAALGLRMSQMNDFPQARYWLSSDDGSRLMQVQPDYVALNWRKKSDLTYPGYEQLRSEFVDICVELNTALQRAGDEAIHLRQVELTYIDVVRPGGLWKSHSDTHKVANIEFGASDDYEQVSFSYSRVLRDDDGSFAGRLHASAQPAIDTETGVPVLNVSTTLRSASYLPKTPLEVGISFLDVAHVAITKNFEQMVREDVKRAWGLA